MGRSRTRELARKFIEEGNPTGWFDALYREAGGDPKGVPWANLVPNPGLVSWLTTNAINGAGQRALVVGCGLGDDAEALADKGFEVTAFDISPEAIRWAKQRFSKSKVYYEAADLFAPPAEWNSHFDFVFECYTLQSLPAEIRPTALEKVARFVAPQGRLLIIARGRDSHEDAGSNPPWPLTKEELSQFENFGLKQLTFEDYPDHETSPTRRFRILYSRWSSKA
jgi:ubiquinone/menaquinone biosynthesis C-methylase UbiE